MKKKEKKYFVNDDGIEDIPFYLENEAKNTELVELPAELFHEKEIRLQNAVNEDIQRLDVSQSNANQLDDMYQALIHKEWSLVEKWTNRQMYEKVQGVKGQLFHLAAENRLSLYDLLLQSRLEQTKEKFNSALKCIKAHYRRHVASYIMSRMEDLTEEIKGFQYRFLELMKSKYKYAETLKEYPSLHQRYLNSLLNQEERYLAFLDKLIIKYEGVVSEELTSNSFSKY